MRVDILFITRKTRGTGGMQRLHEDLFLALSRRQDLHIRRIVPFFSLGFLDLTFPVRAFVASLLLPRKKSIVHLGDAALAPLGVLIQTLTGRCVTATCCGLDLTYPNFFYQWILRRSISSLRTVVCISGATAIEAQKRGVSKENISVIPCGVWPEQCEVKNDATRFPCPTIVCGGRLIPRKGIAWFVSEVMPLLASSRPNLRCSIFGSGPEERAIRDAISEKALMANVRMLGRIAEEAKEDLLSGTDVFVMPNIPVPGDMEGFGIVCIEASARGTAVVASELEGIRDAVIESETGIFFSPLDARDAARAINALISHPLSRSHVSQATHHRYNWPSLADRYVQEVFIPALP